MNRVRSLNLEHVSPAKLMRSEISRHPASAAVGKAGSFASRRAPGFTRKPDAGFVLTDDPATLLQVKVSDDRCAARDETHGGFPAGSGSR